MKKSLIAVCIAALILSACGKLTAIETPAPTQVGGKTPPPIETVEATSRIEVQADALKGLEINVWHPWFGVEASLFEAMVDDFNTINQWGIKVISSGQVNFSAMYENVTQALPMKDKPDVVIALPEHALGWDAEGVVADLTPYVEDPAYGIDPSDFPSVFWTQDQSGQRRVAIPAQRTARFLLWNETWAGELGFDSPPASADGFRQQACRAHQTMRADQTPNNDGMGGWIVDAQPMTDYAWLLAFQGGVLEGDSYRLLTPNNIKAAQFLKKLMEDQCAWQSGGNPFEAFANREALFITASLEDFPEITRLFAAAKSSDKWRVLPFPGDGSNVFVVYGSSYVMLASTPEEQLASWIFIRWMLDPQQDARFVQATDMFPLRTSTQGLLAAYQSSHPQWAEAIKLLPEGQLQPQLASWRTVKVMLGDAFTDMFTRTDLTSGQVAKVLQQIQETAQELNK